MAASSEAEERADRRLPEPRLDARAQEVDPLREERPGPLLRAQPQRLLDLRPAAPLEDLEEDDLHLRRVLELERQERAAGSLPQLRGREELRGRGIARRDAAFLAGEGYRRDGALLPAL